MGKCPLNQSSFNRAKQDTISIFGTIRFWLFETLFVLSLTLFVIFNQPLWANDGTAMTYYQVLVPVAGAILGLIIIFLFSLSVAPCKQRNEARGIVIKLRSTLSELEIIDGFMRECSEKLNEFRRNNSISTGFPLDDRNLSNHRIWFDYVSVWLKQRTYPESEFWYRFVDINKVHPTLDDLIKAYELGFDTLRKIKDTIQLASHKEDSPTE
ncbi:hypothetical protein ACFLVC_04805 [Chloroflexota bacterium]